MGEHRHWTALFTASLQHTDSVLLRGSSGVQDGSPSGRIPRYCNGSLTGPAAQVLLLLSETCARALCVSCRPDRATVPIMQHVMWEIRDGGPAQTSVDSPILPGSALWKPISRPVVGMPRVCLPDG